MLALPGLCASLSQELLVSNMLNAFAAIAIAKALSKQDVLLLNYGGQLACSASQRLLIPIVVCATALLAFMVSNLNKQLHSQAGSQC
jgi:hypothetical protein